MTRNVKDNKGGYRVSLAEWKSTVSECLVAQRAYTPVVDASHRAKTLLTGNVPQLQPNERCRIPVDNFQGKVNANCWFVGLYTDHYHEFQVGLINKPGQRYDEHSALSTMFSPRQCHLFSLKVLSL